MPVHTKSKVVDSEATYSWWISSFKKSDIDTFLPVVQKCNHLGFLVVFEPGVKTSSEFSKRVALFNVDVFTRSKARAVLHCS